MKIDKSELLRRLPSVDNVLRRRETAALIDREGHEVVTEAVRSVLDDVRSLILHADDGILGAVEQAISTLQDAIQHRIEQTVAYSLRRVINATGVILHTNLGRAPLAAEALQHASEVASGYSNLELNLDSGERGKRDVHVDRLFARLLGSEVSTIVVNNNAAAVLIALNTLAEGGEVIVSRGELVEIGGSFRIPDVMSKSGAVLREVGTTNRTRIADYEEAITDRTRLLLRVHRSNFQMVGFTEQPSLEDLVALGRTHGIPVLEDLGSGALFDLRSVGVQNEPGVADSLRAGVDVITFSGDKLLGGPQAGLISGRKDLIARIRSNPLFRALRVDKLIYAALEATLLAYVRRDYDTIPALRMMRMSVEDIEQRARAVVASLPQNVHAEIIDGESVIGGGAAPSATLATKLIAITSDLLSPEQLSAKLRTGTPPVVARVENDHVLLDLRTVPPEQDAELIAALTSAVPNSPVQSKDPE